MAAASMPRPASPLRAKAWHGDAADPHPCQCGWHPLHGRGAGGGVDVGQLAGSVGVRGPDPAGTPTRTVSGGCPCTPTTSRAAISRRMETMDQSVQSAVRRQAITADQGPAWSDGPAASWLLHTYCARTAARRHEREHAALHLTVTAWGLREPDTGGNSRPVLSSSGTATRRSYPPRPDSSGIAPPQAPGSERAGLHPAVRPGPGWVPNYSWAMRLI